MSVLSSRAWRHRALPAAALLLAASLTARWVTASDHQDTADVELNPTMDMTDFYAFPGASPDRMVLVLNSQPAITPAAAGSASFDPNLLYQIKVDNTGDATEDRVIQVVFSGRGTDQTVRVYGPMTPPVTGAMRNELTTAAPTLTGRINTSLGSATGMQVYAGILDDPFYIDLEQFFRIIPDRRPAGGPLAALPATPTASAFRPANTAVNFLRGLNVASIVIELPTAMLTSGGTPRLGMWGTISR
ncbi:MAG TPA: DUF4331 family protein [Gemmatimonadales bacterium]|nr:DUF4331 family protein [Gemmatimonadales bacterium]